MTVTDLITTCERCHLALEPAVDKLGNHYRVHCDTGGIRCPGDDKAIGAYLTPNRRPHTCSCGNPTNGTTECASCVRGHIE
ncbi:hypothetical protein GCM10007304_18150 [Rhodococcoides trifolii]|uniref:Uncharacterized protein n=1 Tax=Rhodococcoides trifolii TaxID=908250 RepID=A0A917CZG5_9NOCA|nr:hypothetical protein [Rhodococcus trifolii]GGG04415.1 hypothetical protein GCM10007304_18150 [Rhodococcus trifolii]